MRNIEPDSEENKNQTRQNQKEVFAIQMQRKKMEEECPVCNVDFEDCMCAKVFKSAPKTERVFPIEHPRYRCRICGGDHKEVQCNQDDFALGNE